MIPISFWTDAWRMSKLTSGNFRDICQMMGCSTWVLVGKVNQQRFEVVIGGSLSCRRQNVQHPTSNLSGEYARPTDQHPTKTKDAPPAIAGTMLSSSPSLTGVSRFW